MIAPLFFLHIPKTAGTTMNAVLDNNFGPEAVMNLYTDEQHKILKETTYDEIARYELVRGHVFVRDFADILDGPVPFRVFTFLRDPVKRVVYEFFFLKQWPKSHLYNYLNDNDVSLAEYIVSDVPELRHRGQNGMTNSLSGVFDGSLEKRLAAAWLHLKDRFVAFGILERFDESLLLLKHSIGLTNTFYEKQNVSSSGTRRDVTDDDVALIREHNRLDIQLYEMAVEEFQRRVDAMGEGFASEVRMFAKINERYQRVSALVDERAGKVQGAIFNVK